MTIFWGVLPSQKKLSFRTLGVSRNMWFKWPLKPHFPRESSPPKHMDSPLKPHFPRQTTYSAKRLSLGKKASQTPRKVSKTHPNFFGGDVTYGHLTFCKKNGSNLVYRGLRSSISNLQTHIGGRHSMLYFPNPINREI